jgi:chromosomal replication initiation ATPase DnaA
VATLDPPDDTLLTAVLAKHFDDRQLLPKVDVIPYLLLRIDRSFEAARDIVERLDRASLTEQRAITRAFASRVLDKTL